MSKKFATILLAIMMAFTPVKTKANPLVINPVTIECTKVGVAAFTSIAVTVGCYIYETVRYPRLPEKGKPYEIAEKKNKSGKIIQRRYYDGKGNAFIDIDLTDHGFSDKHPSPHKHRWIGGERKKAEPLTQREYDYYIRRYDR